MVLSVTSIGDNPMVPGIASETYIPDQLIAGNLKLVTTSATITGGAALKRGTVLGQALFGAVSASVGTAFATGTALLAAVPTPGDTLTVFGTPITFVAADPSGNQVLIGATTAITAQNLLAFLNGSTDVNLIKATYSLSGSTITATARAAGTGANALTLATSNVPAFTLSGATLAGGGANTGNATVSAVSAGAKVQAGEYIVTCLTATTASVTAPSGAQLGTATFGTQFTDAQISFLITAGGTPCIAGDKFVIQSVPSVGGIGYKMASSTGTDGSEDAVAILADDADASGGDVLGGVYLMGEFNANRIILGPGMTITGVKQALRPFGIFIKSSVSSADPI